MIRRDFGRVGILFLLAVTITGCGGKATVNGSGSSSATSVSITSAPASVDPADSTTLTAVVANDKNSLGVAWTLSGAGTLSNQTTTSVTYTAPAASSSSATVTVTATSRLEETRLATAQITIPVVPTVTSTNSGVAGAVGTTYSAQLLGSGGIAPYTWTVTSGNMPAGLSLSSSGLITGTPLAAAAGSTNVTFQLKDAGSPIALTTAKTLTLAITPAPPITFSGVLPPTGTYNQAYAGSAAATGGLGTLTYSVASGALPTGLTLNAATGAVAGTTTVAGTYNFTIQAYDTFGDAASHAYQIVVVAPLLTVTPGAGALPFAVTGQSYSQTLTATGGSGTGYTYTVTGLPANGLNYSSAGGVLTISGTPTGATAVSFGVAVKDSLGGTAGPFTYTITSYNSLTLPTPNPATLGPATINLPYTGTIVAAGGSGNYSWTVTGLPANGLAYSTSGGTLTVTGTPTTATPVSIGVSITDTTTHGSAGPFTYSIPVYASVTLPTPNPATLGPADAGLPYSGTIVAAGGSGNYTWTVAGLPNNGLNYSTTGGTLTISGTPTTQATVTINVSIKDTTTSTVVGPYAYTVAVYSGLVLPAPNPVSLPGGYVSIPYTGTIAASGGSGNYSWQVTGLSDNLSYATSGGTLTVSGTPGATAATVTFSVKLTDMATNNSITQPAYTIAVVVPTPVSLPAPNPSTLPFATTNQAYIGSIDAAGGVPPFTWSVNGVSIPNTGAAVAIADGLSVSNNGTNVLSVSGTPTAIQTVNLTNVKVTDSIGSTQTVSYTVAVYRTSQITGQISLSATCGTGSVAVPTITVKLLSSPGNTVVATTTTDSSGNFTFPSVLAGTYTLSPSITGPSSLFYPATQSVTLANTDANGVGFTVSLGYTVSGTVNYSGANTGQIYLALVPATPCGAGGEGTSIFTPGSFAIRGVPPGNYNLQAWMDLTALANGAPNTSDPTGTLSVSVLNSNLTGQTVTIADNTPGVAPTANPAIQVIAPTDQGVAISYKPVSSNGVEAATSYDVQWSTSSTFSSGNVIHNFKAVGNGSDVWILNNGTAGVTGNPLTNGQTYYFEARARNSAGAASAWTVYGGGTPIGITIGASTTGNEVQGTVTIPGGVTPSGPLYVGYYNQSTNTVYGTRIASPSSSNPFTVYVPTDASNDYVFFEILDQNNDGLIDTGDVANTRQQNLNPIAITGPLTSQNLTLGTANSTAQVGVQYYQYGVNNPTTGYNLNFDVREANKLPVAVTLLSGPNVINPVDISNYCSGCGNVQFQYYVPLNGNTPNVGDAYTLKVTYSDSSSDTETLTPAVTGWNGTTSLVGANDVATSLLPNDQESLQPTFSWGVPAVDSSDTFSYYLFDANNNIVWQIPGQNSNSNGLPSSITSLNWGIDPTDASNDLTSGFTLTDQAMYSWQLNAADAYGNQALTSVTFQASGFL